MSKLASLILSCVSKQNGEKPKLIYFHAYFKEFWSFQKAKQFCKVKFRYRCFLDFVHEAQTGHPKSKAVPHLSMHGVTLLFAAVPVLYKTNNFGMMTVNTDK